MTRLRRGCVSWLLDRGEKVTTPAKPVLLLLVISCYIMSCHVMQNHVAPFHMTSCHAAPTPPLLPELPSATKCYACDAKRHQVPGNTQRRPDYYALKSCYYERHAQAPSVAPATRNGARQEVPSLPRETTCVRTKRCARQPKGTGNPRRPAATKRAPPPPNYDVYCKGCCKAAKCAACVRARVRE